MKSKLSLICPHFGRICPHFLFVESALTLVECALTLVEFALTFDYHIGVFQAKVLSTLFDSIRHKFNSLNSLGNYLFKHVKYNFMRCIYVVYVSRKSS